MTMLQQILTHLPSHRLQFAGILALTLLEALFAAVSITMLIPLTQAVLSSTGDSVWLLRYVPAGLLARPDLMFLLFGLLLILKVLTTVVRHIYSVLVSESLRREWQVTLAEKMIHQPYAAFVHAKRGRMISDLTRQTNMGAVFVFNYFTYLADLVILGFVLASIVVVKWQVAIVIVPIAILAAYIIGRPYYRLSHKLGRRSVSYDQALMSELTESLTGIKEIKISSSEAFKMRNILRLAELTRTNRVLTKIANEVPIQGAELGLGLAVMLVFVVVGSDRQVLNSILPLMVFLSAGLFRAVTLAANVVSKRFKVVNKLPAFRIVTEKLLPRVVETEHSEGGKKIASLDTPIRFEKVSFAYKPQGKEGPNQVLKDLDLELPMGQVVCLFGPSGSGKTTVVDMLVRLYAPDAGRIVANGRDIGDYDLKSWRRLIGYAGQEPMLFYGTIEDNIRLGDESLNEADLRRACERASALEFIETLPDGLATDVGEQGARLSGGQKRRIALARALARRPSLLILDETTNSLDEDMERDMIATLSAQGDLSILLISHRAVSAQWADLSFTLEGGRLRLLTQPDLQVFGATRAAGA